MMAQQSGFWDVDHRLEELSAHGDPLEKLAATVDFEIFRSDLIAALGARDPTRGGHPGFDPVLKFRMLVLQTMHGLSLDQTEYLLRDRLSWMRFCGLGPGDKVPDANTLWDFREALIAANAFDALFERLNQAMQHWSPRRGNATRRTRRNRSRWARRPMISGQSNRPAPGRRTQTRDGRSSSPRRNRRKTAASQWTSPSQPSAISPTSPSTGDMASSAALS